MCLKCWRDCAAGPDGHYPHGHESQAAGYAALLAEREAASLACTPEEQAGEYWDPVRKVDTRKATP